MAFDVKSQTEAANIFDEIWMGQFDERLSDLDLLHYCSCDSAAAIIETKSAYFSPASSMNDWSEVRWAFKIFSSMFYSMNLRMRRGYDIIKRSIELCDRDFDFYMQKCFIFCLSENSNPDGVLSMWRGYGADGHGCALAFNKDVLDSSPARQFPITMYKVKYFSEAECKKEFSCFIANLIEKIDKLKEDSCIESVVAMVAAKIIDISATIKHPGFREEQEVRLIYRYDYDVELGRFDIKSVNIRNTLRPVVVVKFGKYVEFENVDMSLKHLLKGILLGPSNQSLLSQQALAIACVKSGIDPRRPGFFSRSTIPYRAPR